MVIFEAAKAITELSGVTNRELTPAITVLQLFLSSSKPVLRFAAVRTLNKVSHSCLLPNSVTNCYVSFSYVKNMLRVFCIVGEKLNSVKVRFACLFMYEKRK